MKDLVHNNKNRKEKKTTMVKRPREVKDVRANSNVRAVTSDRLIGGSGNWASLCGQAAAAGARAANS